MHPELDRLQISSKEAVKARYAVIKAVQESWATIESLAR
jgi:hypothetical protein